MDAAYLQAAVPDPFTVLGKNLKPFCLGHELLFQRFGIRFSIESTDTPLIEDLLLGVHICSQRYSRDVSLDNYSIPIRVRLFTKLKGPTYIANALKLFTQYIVAGAQVPDYYKKDSETGNFGTPTIQAVKISLMSNLGFSEEEALNTPFSLAFWNHLSWSEAQGSIQIIDDEERARIGRAKAFEAWAEKRKGELFPCSA